MDCDPCKTPLTSPLPLDVVDSGPMVVLADSKGNPMELTPKTNAILYSPDGSVLWTGGSDNPGDPAPVTPNFLKGSMPAGSVMVQSTEGRWYCLIPGDNVTGKAVLVSMAGDIFWQDDETDRLTFSSDSVPSADCQFDFAVWPNCDGETTVELSRASLSSVALSLLNMACEVGGDPVTEGDFLFMCNKGKFAKLGGASRSVVFDEAGRVALRSIFQPVFPPQIVFTGVADGTASFTGFPSLAPGGSCYAICNAFANFSYSATAGHASLIVKVNGDNVFGDGVVQPIPFIFGPGQFVVLTGETAPVTIAFAGANGCTLTNFTLQVLGYIRI